jgi:hypothetical protein
MGSAPATIPEIVDIIVDNIGSDLQTLIASSAINREFYTNCSRRIFRTITLLPEDVQGPDALDSAHSACGKFYQLLLSSPHIADLVCELHIVLGFAAEAPHSVVAAPDLPLIIDTLHSLSIIDIRLQVFEPGQPHLAFKRGKWHNIPLLVKRSLADAFQSPSITEIRLRSLKVPASLLRYFNTVKSLRLTFVDIEVESDIGDQDTVDNPARMLSAHSAYPQLDTLSLICVGAPTDLLRSLCHQSSLDLTQLKTFNLTFSAGDSQRFKFKEGDLLGIFLQRVSLHLEHLALLSYPGRHSLFMFDLRRRPNRFTFYIEVIFPESISLSQLCALRSLTIIIPIVGNPLPPLNHHFEKFHTTSRLETITITCIFPFPSRRPTDEFLSATLENWRKLDSILSNLDLANLHSVNVQFLVTDAVSGSTIYEQLKAAVVQSTPRLRDLGLLNIREMRGEP